MLTQVCRSDTHKCSLAMNFRTLFIKKKCGNYSVIQIEQQNFVNRDLQSRQQMEFNQNNFPGTLSFAYLPFFLPDFESLINKNMRIKHTCSVVLSNGFIFLFKFHVQFGVYETSYGNRTKPYQSYIICHICIYVNRVLTPCQTQMKTDIFVCLLLKQKQKT